MSGRRAPSGPPAAAGRPRPRVAVPPALRGGRRGDVLFVHNNFPGQFGFLAEALKARGHRCAAIGSRTARSDSIPVRRWTLGRGTGKDVYPLAVRAEADLIRGRAAAGEAMALKAEGFDPALIVGHPGWGETCLLKEVFPAARMILHGEFYYRSTGADVGFDPEFESRGADDRFRVVGKNATMAISYLEADAIVCPTPFQASLFPAALRGRIHVIHEGVDTTAVRRTPGATLTLPDGRVLDGRGAPVITYVSRSLEPLRGFHVFMRALPALLDAVPEAQVLIIGDGEHRGYGAQSAGGGSWKAALLGELEGRLDLSRVHFLGRTPHPVMLAALSLSAAHVYFTYPFVLSWSLLEAMACGCLVLGSDTAPVRDAITDGVDGRLLPFFDTGALSAAMAEACRRPEAFAPLRAAARETVVARFDRRTRCLPDWLRLVDEVLAA